MWSRFTWFGMGAGYNQDSEHAVLKGLDAAGNIGLQEICPRILDS